MPRPGPRPYECVRRAWHSDRHQPIRGSLIQEIFRIVNEIHSSATKKNKEWQEKLPVVVLKAEEIMYSKANSEAEYVDLDTLWDRANDAINTIIRRDESNESGKLLQPCIEAALHLGCTPRRSSRSQRNNTPRFYLHPEKAEAPTSVPPSTLGNKLYGDYATNCSFMPRNRNLLATNPMTSSKTSINSTSPVIQKNGCDYLKFPFAPSTISPSIFHQCVPSNSRYSSSSCSVYPLYYGNMFQLENSKSKTPPCKSNSQLMDADRKSLMRKLNYCKPDASNVISQADFQRTSETPLGCGCDLSLRLGPLVAPCKSSEKSWHKEVECGGSSSTSLVGNKSTFLSSKADKVFSFFPRSNADDTLDFSSTKWRSRSQNPNAEATLRKRKVAVSHDDSQFCWPLKLPFNQFNGRISNAGP